MIPTEAEIELVLKNAQSLTHLDDLIRKRKFTCTLNLTSNKGDKEDRVYKDGKIISMDILRDK